MRPKKAPDAAGFERSVASIRSRSISEPHSLYTRKLVPWIGEARYPRAHPRDCAMNAACSRNRGIPFSSVPGLNENCSILTNTHPDSGAHI